MSRIAVAVVYARSERQAVRTVWVAESSPVRAAIAASGLLDEYPEIDLAKNRVGIFGKLSSLERPLRHGDQVEIYRPLAIEARESRRKRAAQSARDAGAGRLRRRGGGA
jgi:putative ubiquitin-RnfH superfamily antitoxin RatB of RatAB toxin-antitoxin module